MLVKAKNISKIYTSKKGRYAHKAIDQFNLEVDYGEFIGIMGPSGSGKSTLLNILATIDQPSAGTVELDGVNTKSLNDQQLSLFRRKKLGFIFQDFHLLETLTVKENILLPLVLESIPKTEMEKRLHNFSTILNIRDILDKRTYEISGGEQQRTAAARALIHHPQLILADEPTGNLDSKAAKSLMDSLQQLNQEQIRTILMVTHDPFAASYCKRVVFIRDGKPYTEIYHSGQRQAFFQKILDVLSMMGGHEDDLPPTSI
ncbi:ABC transporter ATP-binding protein [Lederbergia sp. NSJ-179]|uniref:ABC transporter ATP-binding protein n=1 Tax=Lederbergia sp. NSJ-179 TaxID=2931402 RepID=UPI001FD0D6E8|nr:ABC transporter ATP-binding protein [Lederbergia sp. NSJ-179]MCJ7839721.1 ABC transporter ATP-binding protein [Lederbergia sp. NSJ-179]